MPSLETLFWSLLFVVVLPALAAGGALLVRRRVSVDVLARHNDVAGFIYAVIGVVYAVLLGFTAIIVWEQFRRAQEGVEMEANALGDLYRDAQVFPVDVRRQVEDRLREYARLVIEDEWPAMAEGRSSPETWAAYNQLWRTYHGIEPENEKQRTWYAESVQRMNLLADQRRTRMLTIQAGVPAVMWGVLLGAGAVTIAFSFLFGSRNAWAQGLMTAALAVTICVVLLSIIALEHPFAGISRISPEAFQQALGIIGPGTQPGGGSGP